MVYLRPGSTIDYDTICKISGMLRQLATLEFVNIYYQNLNRCDPVRLFGDEIEYLIVNLDHSKFKARLLPIYPHISKFIQNKHHLSTHNLNSVSHLLNSNDESTLNHSDYNRKDLSFNIEEIGLEKTFVTPEYASYMVECIPDRPYSLFSNYVNNVRKSVYNRRKRLELILLMLGYNHSKITTLTNFSRYGCDDYVYSGDCEFQKVFIENLDPRHAPYFDILITPTNRIYDLITFYNIRRRKIKTYIRRFREGIEEPLENVGSLVNEILLDDCRVVPASSRLVDIFNSYKLFPLLSTHNQLLCQHLLNTYTETGKPTTIMDDNDNAYNDLFNYIMGRVYLYDPKTDYSVNDVNVSNVSNLSKAINVMSFKDSNSIRDNCIAVDIVGAICSLQVTFSCYNLDEARYLYDQLLVLSPIFLSLSSATVAYNGILSIHDNRWALLPALWNEDPKMIYKRHLNFDEYVEADPEGTATNTSNIPFNCGINDYFSKGRCSTNSLFISNSQFCIDNYKYLNDIKVDCDFDSFVHMTKMGVDPILARHISHNLVYDPLTVLDEDFSKVNCQLSDSHYQNFNHTNWNSVRLNHPIMPPSTDNTDSNKNSSSSHIADNTFTNNHNYYNNMNTNMNKAEPDRSTSGTSNVVSESVDGKTHRTLPWRVEFRPLDIQLTDEENVMFICVVSYVVKVLLLKRLNLYMPISLVDINTEVSSKIESCHRDLFYFTEDVTNNKLNVKKFTLHDILFGQVGLFKIVMDHLEHEFNNGDVSNDFRDQLLKYFKHFEQLTLGNTPTNATKLRRFIQTHPNYSGDGTITDQILYDIIQNLTSY